MALKVTEVVSSKEKELPRKNAPGMDTFVSYKLNVEEGSNLHKGVELFQKKETPAPKPGDTIDGMIETGQFGPKIKKNARIGGGQGGGGFRPRDPRETAAIQRQHSQGVAVQVAIAAGWFKTDWNPHDESDASVLKDLARLTDWFQRDIDRGVNLAMYGSKPEKVKEQVKTGLSDVPGAKPGEFEEPKTGSLEGTPWAV